MTGYTCSCSSSEEGRIADVLGYVLDRAKGLGVHVAERLLDTYQHALCPAHTTTRDLLVRNVENSPIRGSQWSLKGL